MNQNNRSPYILGLSCFYHDSSAVILKGNEIISAAQEERFTRKKFDADFPLNAIKSCLNDAGIMARDLDCIAFYEDPRIKLDRIIETQTTFAPFRFIKNFRRVKNWVDYKFKIEQIIQNEFNDFDGEICLFQHHWSHAASAFYPSPFKEATILTIDGIGEWSCTSLAHGHEGNRDTVRTAFPPLCRPPL